MSSFKRLYHALRVVVKAVRTGAIQYIDVSGRGEDYTDKELFQDYGFCSSPLPEAEGIMLYIGSADNAVVIATEDRRYRLTLVNGEVGLYTDEGDYVHLKRNKTIVIHSGNEIDIEAATKVNITGTSQVNVTTAAATITASATVTVNAPTVAVNAATIANVVSPIINLGLESGTKTMPTADFVTLYNSHTHYDPVSGTTSVPIQQAGTEHSTSRVRAI